MDLEEPEYVDVLILILLEDTLWGILTSITETEMPSLNPYSIGRYSVSRGSFVDIWGRRIVLILILLEDTLWVSDNFRQSMAAQMS